MGKVFRCVLAGLFATLASGAALAQTAEIRAPKVASRDPFDTAGAKPNTAINPIPLSALSQVEVIQDPSSTYPEGQPDTALADLQAKSDGGDPQAMLDLSYRYLWGVDGVPKDVEKGHALRVQAFALADAKHVQIYPLPPIEGVFSVYLPQAWEMPVSPLYMTDGPDPLQLEARAKAGDKISMERLAEVYEDGLYAWGLKPDPVQALYWHQRALAAGDKGAASGLAHYYDRQGQFENALPLWVKAAQDGDPQAMENLADRYLAGFHVKQNLTLGRDWCLKAAHALSRTTTSPPAANGMQVVTDARTPACMTNLSGPPPRPPLVKLAPAAKPKMPGP